MTDRLDTIAAQHLKSCGNVRDRLAGRERRSLGNTKAGASMAMMLPVGGGVLASVRHRENPARAMVMGKMQDPVRVTRPDAARWFRAVGAPCGHTGPALLGGAFLS